MKKRSGWPQSLDNGVLKRPTKPDTESRSSSDMDFKSIIAKGENPNGQTSISPAQVTRAGQTAGSGYDCWRWGKPTDGDRWGSNPNLNEGNGYATPSYIAPPKKKK